MRYHVADSVKTVKYRTENKINYNSIRSRGVAISRALDEQATPRLTARLYPKLCWHHTLLKMKAYYLDFRPKIINVYHKERILKKAIVNRFCGATQYRPIIA
jgi:hypothetical protein